MVRALPLTCVACLLAACAQPRDRTHSDRAGGSGTNSATSASTVLHSQISQPEASTPQQPAPLPTAVEPLPAPVAGAQAPNFTLPLLEGGSVTLSTVAKERPVVILFGSFSCPRFRMATPRIEELARRYAKVADFFVVFSQEAHAEGNGGPAINGVADRLESMDANQDGSITSTEFNGAPWMFEPFDLNEDNAIQEAELLAARRIHQFDQYIAPRSTEERVRAAYRLRREVPGEIPILLDSMDNATSAVYGGMPNSAYVIAPGGMIASAMPWAHSGRIESALNSLLNLPAQPKPDAVVDLSDQAASFQRAASAGKKVLFHFTAPECAGCQKMDQTTLIQGAVKGILGGYETAVLDISTDQAWRLFTALGLHHSPAFVVFNPDQTVARQAEGYLNGAEFVSFLQSK